MSDILDALLRTTESILFRSRRAILRTPWYVQDSVHVGKVPGSQVGTGMLLIFAQFDI